MKKLFLITSLCVGSFIVYAQTAPVVDPHAGHNHGGESTKQVVPVSNTVNVQAPEELLSIKDVHDFGKIPQGKPVTYNFEVTNIGKTPYKLDNVVAGCGCTTPQWDKEKSINAGEKSVITVGFNAAAEGPFSKPVTITYNGTQSKVITIKGEVWKTPTASAPANATLNDLKN